MKESEASPTSFRRKPESSVVKLLKKALDPVFQRGDDYLRGCHSCMHYKTDAQSVQDFDC